MNPDRFLAPFGFAAMLLIGWVLFPSFLYRSEEQPIQFSHAVHSEDGAGLECRSCHGFDDQGRFMGIPSIGHCRSCHESAIGESGSERKLVDQFITPDLDVPWRVYARQPDNVWFSHIHHTERGELTCETCHGDHGISDSLRTYEVNRISGYGRDIWGHDISGFTGSPGHAMKMTTCSGCHKERGVRESCLGCHR